MTGTPGTRSASVAASAADAGVKERGAREMAALQRPGREALAPRVMRERAGVEHAARRDHVRDPRPPRCARGDPSRQVPQPVEMNEVVPPDLRRQRRREAGRAEEPARERAREVPHGDAGASVSARGRGGQARGAVGRRGEHLHLDPGALEPAAETEDAARRARRTQRPGRSTASRGARAGPESRPRPRLSAARAHGDRTSARRAGRVAAARRRRRNRSSRSVAPPR